MALDARNRPVLSIVAPCFNEEQGVEEFHRRMTAAAQATVGSDYELILLNDGSTDHTWAIMADLVRRDPRVVAINLSRRHGHQLDRREAELHMHGERGDGEHDDHRYADKRNECAEQNRKPA